MIRPGRMRFQLFLVEAIVILLLPNAQDRQESFLGDFNIPDHLHALLAALLLFQQLLLAGDIAAIALGQHVLAHGFDIGARDHPPGGISLDGHDEQLARDELFELGDHRLPFVIGIVAVDDGRQGIHRLFVDQDLQLDQVIRAVFGELVVQRGIAARARFQLVEEIDDQLGERDLES